MKMFMNMRWSLFFIMVSLILPALFSCSRNAIYEQSQATTAETWNKDVMLVFDGLEITDTTSLYSFSLIVRHTRSFPFSNLYLFMHTTFPDHKILKDTIEVILAKPDGQWLGKGFGNIREYKISLNESLKFPIPGKYSVKFQQGMRTDNLVGIKDLSIQIRKAS